MTRFLALLAFLLSGVSTLIYEIVWIRWLGDLFGVTYHAITTVVTVFMVGLALGALLAGRLVDRSERPLRIYMGLELAIGVLGLGFPWALDAVTRVYHGLHASLEIGFFGHMMVRFLLASLILLPPTLAMGATLPCLARFFVQARERVGIDLGRLYGINTLGAAVGCALTGWVLVTGIGLSATNRTAVALNLAAAALAFGIGRVVGPVPPAPADAPAPSAAASGHVPRWLLLGAFFGSGFTSIGYELVWTRVAALLHPNLHASVFTLVLTLFLLGTGIGSAAYGSRLLQRVPAVWTYIGLQLLAGVLALYSPYLMLGIRQAVPDQWYGFDEQVRQSIELFMSWPELVLLAIVLGGASFLFGMTFPVGNRLVVGELRVLGSRVGAVYFLTTIGGVLGSFVTGFLLLPLVSAKTTLLLLGSGNLVLAAVVLAAALPRRVGVGPRGAVAALAATAALATFVAVDRHLPAHVFLNIPVRDVEVVAYHDGRSSTDGILVRRDAQGAIEQRWLFSSGEFIGIFPFGTWYPLAAHPDPRSVLVLAFDSGHNSAMALADPRIEAVTSVDISDGQSVTQPWLAETHPRRQGEGPILDDPRFTLVSNDARNHLATTTEHYDVIYQGVAIYANYFHMSTVEFFELCRDRLGPDGIYATKLHPEMVTEPAFRRVLATFAHVFPSAYVAQSELDEIYLLMGSPSPDWRLSRAHLQQVWPDVAQAADFEPLSVDEYLGVYLLDHAAIVEAAGDAELLWDDHPMRVPDALVSVDTDFDALGYRMQTARPDSDGPLVHRAITDRAVPLRRVLREQDAESIRAAEAGRAARWRPMR